jgi:hypothetical protein
VLLAELYGLDAQAEQLTAPQSTSDQHGEGRVIPLATERIAVHTRQKPLALLGGEPVPNPDSNPAHSLHPSDSRCEFRTEQARIGCLIRHTPDGGQPRLIVVGAYSFCSR